MVKKKVVVKYANAFNNIQFTDFSASELDVFMLICGKVRAENAELFTFSFGELKKLLGIGDLNNSYFLRLFNSVGDKLSQLNYTYCDDTMIERAVLFPTFRAYIHDTLSDVFGEVKACTVIVRINPDCRKIFVDFSKQFTKFELQEFISLKSKYSKNLYRLLKQWRLNGRTETYTVEKLKALLDYTASQTMDNKYFMRNTVVPAVEELTQRGCFSDLKAEVVRDQNRRGRPVTGYYFTFTKEVPQKKEPQQKTTAPRAWKTKSNKFNNFSQRDYNYDDIESYMCTH